MTIGSTIGLDIAYLYIAIPSLLYIDMVAASTRALAIPSIDAVHLHRVLPLPRQPPCTSAGSMHACGVHVAP